MLNCYLNNRIESSIQIRLSDFEQKMIKKSFRESFEEREIYLFGSRVDDTQN